MENDKWDIVRIGLLQGIRKYRNNSIWTMFPKVISKRVDFLPTHDPQVALFPTFTWNLRSWCWWSVPSLFSIDQSLAEIQPLNQYFSTSLSSQPYNFWTKINKKNLFSKFCSAKSKDHLSQFWTVLDQFSRRSSEKTEFCTCHNGSYCNAWILNISYWLWSAWRDESGVLSFIFLPLVVCKL